MGAAGVNNFLTAAAMGGIIGVCYILYLAISCLCSDIRGFITNMKAFDDYKNIYDSMVNGRGFFTFQIECYHYETTTDEDGNSSSQKVVTHSRTERYNPLNSEDDSGSISGIEDITKYVFITYLKKYYFANEQSARNYDYAWQGFIKNNTRD